MSGYRVWLCAFSPFLVLVGALPAALGQDHVQAVPLDEVRLLDGPFRQAQEWDIQYMLKLEPDRLLAPFLREAGLPAKAQSYGNWENEGLDGHTAGHYLSALAFMYASTGDPEMKRRLDYMVDELAACQRASGDGYVGGIPKSHEFWADIAAGHVEDMGKRWVPWYNLHKTFAGLRDAWLVTHNEKAKEVLIGMSDWCAATVANLSDAQMQQMLDTEQGGMNEVLADVSAITGDPKYLDLAKRFDHQAILQPLEAGQDKLDGLHANTQIPKVIGFQRISELSDDPKLAQAAQFFWETVTGHRSVAIGGNSVQEHFNPANDFSSMIDMREGPETCNSYNMLKLTEHLFDADPQARYADFWERLLYNHILTTVNEHGFVYFTPMRPGHYRTYSTAGESFWCCVGTGMENHGKYGEFIYSQKPGTIYVNLFIPSELDWREQGAVISQETKFPDEPHTRLTIKLARPTAFAICLRHPVWVKKGAFRISIDGALQPDNSDPSSYVTVSRTWQNGDTIDLGLPMETSCEQMPDGSPYFAYLYGPLVLAATTGTNDMTGIQAGAGRWDHVPNGPLLPLDQAPTLVCTVDKVASRIRQVDNQPMTFQLADLRVATQFPGLKLVPFYHLPDCRYIIYWKQVSLDNFNASMAQLQASETAAMALDKATVDRVSPGEQQPETDHHYQGDSTSRTGFFSERHWRDTRGWFSYDLRYSTNQPMALAVTYWGGDTGRHFDILVDEAPLAEVTLQGEKQNEFETRTYPIPSSLIGQAPTGVLTVKFAARSESIAGGVFDVRLISIPPK